VAQEGQRELVTSRRIDANGSACTPSIGFDHGAGHPLLFLDDAKAPRGQKIKKFNGLGDDPFNASVSLF
jgi:hypothetical protein